MIFLKHFINIYNLLSIKEVLGYKKIRIGSIGEGGYILLNDLKEIKIAYTVHGIINPDFIIKNYD